MSPNIEEFKRAIQGDKPTYVPIAELGIHPSIKEKFLGRPIQNMQDDIDFWHQAGYDYIKLQPIADFNPDSLFLQDGEDTEVDDTGHVSRNWAVEGKGVITNWEEFEKYIFPKKADFSYARFEQVKTLLPEGMGVIGQYGDIYTMVWQLMGFETFSMSLYDNPELVEALFEKIGELVLSMFAYFADCDVVDVLWYSDDIAFRSGLMMSPQILRKYFFPWLTKIGQLAHANNKPFIYHTDGKLWDVMTDIIEAGVDALHPIEPQAMSLAELYNKYGDQLTFIGHIDVDLLSRGTPEQVREKVKQNIEVTSAENGGYCVGSGNSVPDYVKFENYKAMLAAAYEFGGRNR